VRTFCGQGGWGQFFPILCEHLLWTVPYYILFQKTDYVNVMASLEENLDILMTAYTNYMNAKTDDDKTNANSTDIQSNGINLEQRLTEAYRKYTCLVVSSFQLAIVLGMDNGITRNFDWEGPKME